MRQKKILVHLATVLTLILATIPALPAHAATGPTIAITPSSVTATPPSTFTVAVTLANIPSLIGYDVILTYNAQVLTATHVGGGNAFACVTASPPCGSTAPYVINSTVQVAGQIEVSQLLLACATCPGFASVTNATLFTVAFSYPSGGSSPIIISGPLGQPVLTGIVNGAVGVLPTPTIVNGKLSGPPAGASAEFFKWKDKVASHELNLTLGETVQTIHSNVINTGTNIADVELVYTITSATGSTTTVTSGVVELAPGTTTIISTSYTVPPTIIRYFVLANLMVGASGSPIQAQLPPVTDTFSYLVAI